ncbi:MAG TPA: endo-1,4-beta-xylanase, partial [Flavisolibacter sp.]|nr:endo-1,4-beta-xylanase [Flavisolibacter sp.]
MKSRLFCNHRNSQKSFFTAGCFLLLFVLANAKANAQTSEQAQVEKALVATANANIEKYRKGNANLVFTDAKGNAVKNYRVEINQQTHQFLFGNFGEELFDERLSDEQRKVLRARFTDLFNFIELDIKWLPYEREQGKPKWQKLQEKLDWCKQNGITPKGHALGWTNVSGTPPWLMKLDSVQAGDLYKARIFNLVGGFKNQIHLWDVVNEPVTTIPWNMALTDTLSKVGQIDAGNRYNVKGISLQQVIPWVENSLRWASAADPTADLMLNEFYVVAKPEVRERFYNLIQALQERKVPLTGIGIQAHEPREMWFSPQEVVTTFTKFDSLGLPLHITEFIPQSSGKAITGSWRTGAWTEEAQADFAEQFYTLAFGHPSMASIHWWGLSDRMIWLKGGGLLDSAFNPKPVYNRLQKLIKETWMTKGISLATSKQG